MYLLENCKMLNAIYEIYIRLFSPLHHEKFNVFFVDPSELFTDETEKEFDKRTQKVREREWERNVVCLLLFSSNIKIGTHCVCEEEMVHREHRTVSNVVIICLCI